MVRIRRSFLSQQALGECKRVSLLQQLYGMCEHCKEVQDIRLTISLR